MSLYIPDVNIPRPDFLGGGSWSITGLTDISIVFGRNGSGKSLLLRGWRDADENSAHYVIPERVGDVVFEPGYIARSISAAYRRQDTSSNYLDNYRQRIITRVQSYLTRRGAQRTALIATDLEDIEKFVGLLLPDFSVRLVEILRPTN